MRIRKPKPGRDIFQLIQQAVLAALLSTSSPAGQSGFFTYDIVDEEIEITDYPQDQPGPVRLPAEIQGLPVTSIGFGAFSDCSLITSVELPDTVTFVGQGAFSRCSGITQLSLPASDCRIWSAAFNGCSGLTEVVFPDGIRSISAVAFYNCTSLSTITLPESLQSIGGQAFAGCSSLTSITIPASVTAFDSCPFADCTSLTNIQLAAGNPILHLEDGVLFKNTVLWQFPPGVGGDYLVPADTTYIAEGAFQGSSLLTSITLPEGLTGIDRFAFSNCSGLTALHIPSTTTTIDRAIASHCSALQAITIEEGNLNFLERDGALYNSTFGTLLQYPPGRPGEFTIHPATFEIAHRAFAGATELTVVHHPRGLGEIGTYAFVDCSSLTEFRGSKSLTSIGNYAFVNCQSLTELVIPRLVDGFGYRAFFGCSQLRQATFLGSRPTYFGGQAFDETHPNFTIRFLSSQSGFTTPKTRGYAAEAIDETIYPAANWLLQHDLPLDTDLHSDPDGDGIDLFGDFAFALQPGQRFHRTTLSVDTQVEEQVLRFRSATNGVRYTVEKSSDLKNWTSTGFDVLHHTDGYANDSAVSVPATTEPIFFRVLTEEE